MKREAAGSALVERHIQVVRTARFFQLGELCDATTQLWFVCHGYRQLANRFIRRFAGVVEVGGVVVAPEALSRFYIDPAPGRHGAEIRVGASWMTRTDRKNEVRDYVRYLDGLAARVLVGNGNRRRPKTVVLGFSQGAHTAARWAALGTTVADELVLWGEYLPPDPKIEDRLAGTRVTLVFGDEDPASQPEYQRRQDERLAAAGIAPERRSFRGGHRVDPDVVRALAKGFRA